MSEDYKVELDVYSGPLDLLLHLVSRDELTIEKIPVARIADQFLAYLESLHLIDIEIVGDFLVMAARLTEMKSRALLPRITTDDEEIDPDLLADESDLIQRLLEYRGFKEVARWLRRRSDVQGLCFPPGIQEIPQDADGPEEEALLPEGVTVYDLLSAFVRISREVLLEDVRRVVYDDVPIEEHISRILDRIQHEGILPFTHLLPPEAAKVFVIGAFLALLELIKQKRIKVDQEEDFGSIRIEVAEEEPDEPLPDPQEPLTGDGTALPPAGEPAAGTADDPAGETTPSPAEEPDAQEPVAAGEPAAGEEPSVDGDETDPYHGPEAPV